VGLAPTVVGRAAEQLAAEYLQARGITVLDRNWRNRWCELDIVARSSEMIRFVEVKYRRSAEYGAGYEYVTPAKLQRLARAALAWRQAHRHTGDYAIDVISITGPMSGPEILYLPNITAD